MSHIPEFELQLLRGSKGCEECALYDVGKDRHLRCLGHHFLNENGRTYHDVCIRGPSDTYYQVVHKLTGDIIE